MKLKDILKIMRRDSIFEVFVYNEETERVGEKFIYGNDYEPCCEDEEEYYEKLRKEEEENLDKYRDYYIMSMKAFKDCRPSLTFLVCKNEEDIKKDSIWLML